MRWPRICPPSVVTRKTEIGPVARSQVSDMHGASTARGREETPRQRQRSGHEAGQDNAAGMTDGDVEGFVGHLDGSLRISMSRHCAGAVTPEAKPRDMGVKKPLNS